MSKDKISKILFVCTGNSCRSIMAEGLLKKMLDDKGKSGIEVSSAGVFAMEGFSPSDNTVTVMNNIGADVTGYKSARLTPALIQKADLILVMEYMHREEVLNLAPGAKDKVHLLGEYAKKDKRKILSSSTIPDPMGKPLEVYERVLKMIEELLKVLVERL